MKPKLGRDFVQEKNTQFIVENNSLPKSEVSRETFFSQLIDFSGDLSYLERFSGCTLRDRYGVQVFKYRPHSKLKSALLQTDITGKLLSINDVTEATHIGKIISLPTDIDSVKYKLGDLVLLKPSETVGTGPNPDWIFINQFSQSNMEPKMDKYVPQETYRFVSSMFDDAFLPPIEFKTESHEIETFALEPYRIVGEYKLKDK